MADSKPVDGLKFFSIIRKRVEKFKRNDFSKVPTRKNNPVSK